METKNIFFSKIFANAQRPLIYPKRCRLHFRVGGEVSTLWKILSKCFFFIIENFPNSQTSKKSGSWDLGTRTLFWRISDIFGWDLKCGLFVDIWLISLLKIKHNLMAIDHHWMNKGFEIIFIKKINLICKLFKESWIFLSSG